MMGSGAPRNDLGNLYDLLALVKDEEKYKNRVAELDQRIKEAQHILEQAAENNRKAEETKRVAADVLGRAHDKNVEANTLKREQERLTAETALREEKLAALRKEHAASAASLDNSKRQALAEFAEKDKALAEWSQALTLAEAEMRDRSERLDAELAAQRAKADAENAEIRRQATQHLNEAKQFRDRAQHAAEAMEKKRSDYEAFIGKLSQSA